MITRFLIGLRVLPRWIIICIDIAIVAISSFLGYALRFNFDFTTFSSFNPQIGIIVNSLACLVGLLVTKSYSGIVRYTGLKDGLRVLYTLIMTHLISAVINFVYFYFKGINLMPFSVLLISFLASFVFLTQYRLIIKNVFSYYGKLYSQKLNVAIFGAGQMGAMTKHLLDDDNRSNYKVALFFEDDINKIGKEINGTPIYHFQDFAHLINKFDIKEIVIAVNRLSLERKNDIVDQALQYNLKVRSVPELNSWVKGELNINQIQEIKIEDLLERETIRLENELVSSQIKNKVILVTGAVGSIGSELVRQINTYQPSIIILLDQAESGLYDILTELGESSSIETYVADITNKHRIIEIFEKHMPNIVYHAAAYKHVPLMENNPFEAVNCNIIGTKIVADAAVSCGVDKFVMVSTDKAVNPTNVMGASKRMAEMYVQSLNHKVKTKFITTRFGNVLGSNGSVIPLFKRQIKLGGPLTVTHPDVTRYFMTIKEACQLIMEAGCMGEGGEIFIFDMGKSVCITDLAQKMIKLSGFIPYEEIDIVYTGLRSGEKLYEELLSNNENTIATHHPKILIAKVQPVEFDYIENKYNQIEQLMDNNGSDMAYVSIIKETVPEFISNQSIYQVLDK